MSQTAPWWRSINYVGVIPPPEAEFCPVHRNDIDDAGDLLIAQTESLSKVSHMYIARWRTTRNPTSLTPT